MKSNVSKTIFCIILIFISANSCIRKDTVSDLSIFDVSEETEWDYWIVAKDGSNLFVRENHSKPSIVYYTPVKGHEGYAIYFDDEGLPTKAYIQQYLFYFGNFNGNFLDASIVLPDGTIKVVRNIESPVSWDRLYLKSSLASGSDWFRWIGEAVGGIACAVGILGSPATAGISLTLAVGCGGTVVSILAEFLPEDFKILGLTGTAISSIAGAVGCINTLGLECALSTAATAFAGAANTLEREENLKESAELAKGIVTTGNGDVKITLSWATRADLDLHVVDPYGEEIWWKNKNAISGGYLDFDNTEGFGKENVFWKDGSAPPGIYRVYVHYYDWRQSWRPYVSPYSVYVKAFNNDYFFKGDLVIDELDHVATFDKNGLKSALLFEFEISRSVKP